MRAFAGYETEQKQFMVDMKTIIEENEGKLVAGFATLGNYDIVSIVEAPNDQKWRSSISSWLPNGSTLPKHCPSYHSTSSSAP
jgi:hypothetical protein